MDRHAIVGRDGRTDRQLISMAGIDFPNCGGIRKLAHGFGLGVGHYCRPADHKEVVETRTQLALAIHYNNDQLVASRCILDQPAGK